jgi:hypothetical protein
MRETDKNWVSEHPEEAAVLIDRLKQSYDDTVEDFNAISDDLSRLQDQVMKVAKLSFELCASDDNANLYKLNDAINGLFLRPAKGRNRKTLRRRPTRA